jgi:xanthine/CO dehydrogenase XdhC/CoxF family maturation factor
VVRHGSLYTGFPGYSPLTSERKARTVKEIVDDVEVWRGRGERVAIATVIATRKSAPRPVGAKFAVSETGQMCGSVSGGCVESDVFEHAQRVLESGEPRLLSYGISDDDALNVGLPCGGEIDVFVELLD